MNLLRQTVRKLVLELYDLSPEELEKLKKHGPQRGTGIQSKADQARDRKKMQDFNKLLNTSPAGQQIIQQFRSGDGSIQVLHSVSYWGIYTDRELDWSRVFSDWIEKNDQRIVLCDATSAVFYDYAIHCNKDEILCTTLYLHSSILEQI